MTGRTLRFDLPLPPSVNAMFANAERGRVKTALYRRWQKAALAEIQVQARGMTFADRFRLVVLASDLDLTRRRDCDNLAKAVCDALAKAGIIAGDCHKHMRAITLAWSAKLPARTCRVHVIEIPAAPVPKPSRAQAQTKTREKSVSSGAAAAKFEKTPATDKRRVAGALSRKSVAAPASVMAALRRKGINISANRVKLQ